MLLTPIQVERCPHLHYHLVPAATFVFASLPLYLGLYPKEKQTSSPNVPMAPHQLFYAHLRLCALMILIASAGALTDQSVFAQDQNDDSKIVPSNLNEVILRAFESTHDGWSSDEVILNDELNAAFIAKCKKELPDLPAARFNWQLMNLRKAGKLKTETTKSNRASVSDVAHIAEIAARAMHDRYSISSDQIMADPDRRAEFNKIAMSINEEVDLYRVRKAAFQLRKTRKLRPELILRIADWGREIKTFTAEQISTQAELIDARPGVYIFRDKTGYLYIGQTDDLRERLKTHLDQSHNQSLAKYLGNQNFENVTIEVHSFDPESQAKKTSVRRAYESELIASRKPRFNIQP